MATLDKNIYSLDPVTTTASVHLVGEVAGVAKKFPADLFSPRGKLYGVVALTGTAETLLASHEGCLVTMNNASAQTLTVPQDTTLVLPIGARVRLMRLGAGQITVQAGSGATVRFAGSKDNFAAQYAVCELIKIAANTWVFTGDTATT